MTVQIRAASTVTVLAGTSLTVSKPTGVAAGDLLFLAVGLTASANNLPSQDGWVLLPEGSINGDNSIAVWVKTAGASEPSSYTVAGGATGTTGAAILALYSDSGAALGIEDVAYQINASGNNRVFPSVDLVSGSGYHVCLGHYGSTFVSTPPGGYSEHWDTTVSGSKFYAMSKALAASGASGTATATGNPLPSKCVSIAVAEGALVTRGPRPRASATSGSLSVSSSIDVTAPSTIEAGDYLLLQLTLAASRTVSDPAGWTPVASVTGAGGIYAWAKIADGSEASSTITINFTGGSTTMSLAVTPFYSPRGWDIELDDLTTTSLTAATSMTFPSITPTAADSTLCVLVGRAHTTGFDPDTNGDIWRWFDTGSSNVRLSLLLELLSDAGATGTRTVAWSGGTLACTAIVLDLIEVEPVTAATRRIYPSEGYSSVVFAGVDLTPYLKLGDLVGDVEQLDSMSLADTHPTSEPGSTTWQISLEGPLTKVLDDLLGKDALAPPLRDLVITVGEPDNATTYTWTAGSEVGAFVSNYRVGPNVQFGEVPFRADLNTSGEPVRGTA